MCKKNKKKIVSLFLGIKVANSIMRRSGVSIYNDPVLVDHYVMILCRHNASDNVILDHVNNPAVSQLCSFITTHVLFFSSPPLAVTFNVGNDSGETLLLYHFCLLASTGGCTRSTGTYSVAVTSVWHCYDLWCRAQCEYETFPTMLGWWIVLHLSFFFSVWPQEIGWRMNRQGPLGQKSFFTPK